MFASEISEKSRNFIRRCLEIEEEDRISWEEAFNHPLFREEPRKISKPVVEIEKVTISEDKENNFNSHNHVRTPNKTPTAGDKSPTLFRKQRKDLSDLKLKKDLSDVKVKKGEENCLTPKSRIASKVTPSKVTPSKSGLKTGKLDLTGGKKEKDLSTKKKQRVKKEVSLL